jgi:hypothetical protein
MSMVIAAGFGVLRAALSSSIVLFVANSAGYFIGSALNDVFRGKTGMLLWGAMYGLTLGAGLGAVLYSVQAQRKSKSISEQKQMNV